MKLRLESFDKILVLFANDSVSAEEARILLAGVSKLEALNRPWVIVDLYHARFDEGASLILREGIESQKRGEKDHVKVRWVGGPLGLCQFEDLEEALEKLKFKELKELGVKVELEIERETLSNLIAARKRVIAHLGETGVTIPILEDNFITLNRSLRNFQSNLINRILDPIFSELSEEPRCTPDQQKALSEAVNVALPEKKRPALVKVSSASPYSAASLKNRISKLREEIKELREDLGNQLIEGGDRAVSLILENDVIRSRIQEVREVWLKNLFLDGVVTQADFEAGFEPLMKALNAAA